MQCTEHKVGQVDVAEFRVAHPRSTRAPPRRAAPSTDDGGRTRSVGLKAPTLAPGSRSPEGGLHLKVAERAMAKVAGRRGPGALESHVRRRQESPHVCKMR